MKRYFLLYALGVLLFAGCNEDPDVEVEVKTEYEKIFNDNLNAALKKLGFEYTDDGELVVDEVVRSTTSLDLSSCSLTNLNGIDAFEALESVDLSDNDFGTTFDFRYFGSTIKDVNLSDNTELQSYSNLVDKRALDVLTLPSQAKWSRGDVIDYITSEGGAATKVYVVGSDGVAEQITTKREIPDSDLRDELKALYPSIFGSDDLVDMTKSLTNSSDLVLSREYADLEGVEYILFNSNFEGQQVVLRAPETTPYTMDYFALGTSVAKLTLVNVVTPNGLDLDSASALSQLTIVNNSSLTALSLSSNFLGSSVAHTSVFDYSLTVMDCPLLKELTLPAEGVAIGKIYLSNLPKLASFDMSQIKLIHTIAFNQLPLTAFVMPQSFSEYCDGWGRTDEQKKLFVATDATVTAKSAISVFLRNMASAGAEVVDLSAHYVL